MSINKYIKVSVFIFGSFSFGWAYGTVLHELGHAIAVWATGGVVQEITINPLSWSYTFYSGVINYPQLVTWSGLILGSAMGLFIFFLVRKWTSYFLVPFLFLGLAPLLLGGGYYLVDTFVSTTGDAYSLIQAGVSKYIVLSVAFITLALGTYYMIQITDRLGIKSQDTFIERVSLLGSGIIPFFILTLIYAVLYAKEDIPTFFAANAVALCFVLFISWVSLRTQKQDEKIEEIEWEHTFFAALLGLTAIVAPYLIFN